VCGLVYVPGAGVIDFLGGNL